MSVKVHPWASVSWHHLVHSHRMALHATDLLVSKCKVSRAEPAVWVSIKGLLTTSWHPHLETGILSQRLVSSSAA